MGRTTTRTDRAEALVREGKEGKSEGGQMEEETESGVIKITLKYGGSRPAATLIPACGNLNIQAGINVTEEG